jgi:hypothetical protein
MHCCSVTLLLACIGCGDASLPPVHPAKIANAADAKWLARQIAAQKCRFYAYKSLGIEDYGAQQFDCDRGRYTLELGQTHLFDRKFFAFAVDDPVTFRYSEKLLMKPQYVGEGKPQDANPAYYLEPIR